MEIEKLVKDKEEMKKQGRRRCNKPYKERLMNMAEARREIATALKFHRASMNQQQAQSSNHQHPLPPLMEQQQQQQQQENSNSNNYYSSPIPHHYPIPISPPPLHHHHQHLMNLALPNQTLGLNLNIEGLCKSIKTNEIGPDHKVKKAAAGCCEDDDDDDDDPFEQVMEFPPWLINANETSCLQHHHHYSPDPALPWMDIGEIEGMDGEWLA